MKVAISAIGINRKRIGMIRERIDIYSGECD
jgi:hypothetical protein